MASTSGRDSCSYRVVDGVFLKAGLSDPALEYEKAGRLHAVSAANGFIAPEPVSWREAAGELGVRYIEGLESIRKQYLTYMETPAPRAEGLELIREAGRVLACIHRGLPTDGLVNWTPSASFRKDYESWSGASFEADLQGVPLVPAHCDYGFSNVCVTSGGGASRLAVIDPSPNGFVTLQCNLLAPPYLDVANFATCLEGLVPLRHYARANWSRLRDVRSAFLAGYGTGGYPIDQRILGGMIFATASAYFQSRFGVGLRKRLALLALFNTWKGNVERFT